MKYGLTQDHKYGLKYGLNGVLRQIVGFRPTTATHLLYMAPTQGGMGFPSLQDYIQRRK